MRQYKLDANGKCQRGRSKAAAMVPGTGAARAVGGDGLGASGGWGIVIARSTVAVSEFARSKPRGRGRPRHTSSARNHRLPQRGEGTVSLGGRNPAVCQPGYGPAHQAQGEAQADQARRSAVLHREEHEGRQGRETAGAVVGGAEKVWVAAAELRPRHLSGRHVARTSGGLLRRENENCEFAELGGLRAAEAGAGARTDARPPGSVVRHREMD